MILNHLLNSGGNCGHANGIKTATPNSNHIRVEGSNEQTIRQHPTFMGEMMNIKPIEIRRSPPIQTQEGLEYSQ
jgi:hypothetical protein